MAELEIARLVVEHFKADGWTVFQEVPVDGPIADIVVQRDGRTGVIEVKDSMTLEVIGQAWRWLDMTHLVWIATPTKRTTRARQFAGTVLRQFGIGELFVFLNAGPHAGPLAVAQRLTPSHRPAIKDDRLLKALRAQHASGDYAEAGAQGGGGRFTRFRETCENLERTVAGKPGITLAEAVAATAHHYSSAASARASLRKGIEQGLVHGVRLRLEGARVELHPAEAAP